MMSLRHPSETEEGEEDVAITDPADPRYELVQQLLAYKRFKDAAHMLDHRRVDFAARFPLRPAPYEAEPLDPDEVPPLDMEDVSVWDLLEAFTSLMDQINVSQRTHEVIDDDTPIELIEAIRPDVLVKGADYTREQVVGAELVTGYGGQVLLARLEEGHSTTKTIARAGGSGS